MDGLKEWAGYVTRLIYNQWTARIVLRPEDRPVRLGNHVWIGRGCVAGNPLLFWISLVKAGELRIHVRGYVRMMSCVCGGTG